MQTEESELGVRQVEVEVSVGLKMCNSRWQIWMLTRTGLRRRQVRNKKLMFEVQDFV
jgi:hypothetical protein